MVKLSQPGKMLMLRSGSVPAPGPAGAGPDPALRAYLRAEIERRTGRAIVAGGQPPRSWYGVPRWS